MTQDKSINNRYSGKVYEREKLRRTARKIAKSFMECGGIELQSKVYLDGKEWNILITIVRQRDDKILSPPEIAYIIDSEDQNEWSIEFVDSESGTRIECEYNGD